MAAAGLLPAGLGRAEQWNNSAFAAKNIDELLKVLGASAPKPSAELVLSAPEIAENGAVVPVEIESKLPDTRSIAILIEKNPNVLAAYFTLPSGTLPWLQTRVKMAETCTMRAPWAAAASATCSAPKLCTASKRWRPRS